MDLNKWIEAVRHPLGLGGFALFLFFFILPKIKKGNAPSWYPLAAYSLAIIALIGGMALSWQSQISQATINSPSLPPNDIPPYPLPEPPNEILIASADKIKSPEISGDVKGDVNINYGGQDRSVSEALPKLIVTSLSGANSPEPFDGYGIIKAKLRLGSFEEQKVYPKGAKVSIELSRDLENKASIIVKGLKMIYDFVPGKNPSLAYKLDADLIHPAGTIKPWVFYAGLNGKKKYKVMRKIKGKTIRAKSNNFFDTEDIEQITLTTDDDARSFIIEVKALKAGLYTIRFVFTYSVLGEVKTVETNPPLNIYYNGG